MSLTGDDGRMKKEERFVGNREKKSSTSLGGGGTYFISLSRDSPVILGDESPCENDRTFFPEAIFPSFLSGHQSMPNVNAIKLTR